MFAKIYMLFALLGLMSVAAAFILGFRFHASAPMGNYLFNVLLYSAFIAVHIAMTTPWFKRLAYGRPEGAPGERRVYITVSVVTWVAVYFLHRPVPGFGFVAPEWLVLLGLCGVLLSVVAFFEFATFDNLAALVAVPGVELSHTAGAETPLLTEGPYAQVRHPMYRAFFYLGASSLLMHPNAGQLLFAIMVLLSFVAFIPFEERQLLKARGEEYARYMQRVPYRILRGVW